jgi:hypothetical protein
MVTLDQYACLQVQSHVQLSCLGEVVESKPSVVCDSVSSFVISFIVELYTEYVHSKENRVVPGRLVGFKCTAKLDIWFPVNPKDLRAVVLPHGAHSHNILPEDKMHAEMRGEYISAAHSSHLVNPTAAKVDRCI